MGEPSTLRISHYNDTLEPTEMLGILFEHARKLVFKLEFSKFVLFRIICQVLAILVSFNVLEITLFQIKVQDFVFNQRCRSPHFLLWCLLKFHNIIESSLHIRAWL